MTKIKNDFVELISGKTGLQKVLVKRILDEFFAGMRTSLNDGDRIELRNFGVFLVKQRKGKMGRNPRTGERVAIPERVKIVFKPSRIFKKKKEKSPPMKENEGLF